MGVMPEVAAPETGAPSSLFERDAQLAQFNSLFDAARRGDGRLVVIEGSPGIGKTRLLVAAGAAAKASRFTVLSARAGELESTFSFGVVRQLFEAPLAALTPEDREMWWSGAAARAQPLFAAAGSSVDPESSFAMLHGLYWLAANVSLANPAVLLIDDLHWADAPSLRWKKTSNQRGSFLSTTIPRSGSIAQRFLPRSCWSASRRPPRAIFSPAHSTSTRQCIAPTPCTRAGALRSRSLTRKQHSSYSSLPAKSPNP